MSFDYGKMRDTATRLLKRFAQGGTKSVTVTTIAGVNPWDAPSESKSETTFHAVASGVSEEYLGGSEVTMNDTMLICVAGSFSVGQRVDIDGRETVILRVDNIPPAGTAIVHRVFVKG